MQCRIRFCTELNLIQFTGQVENGFKIADRVVPQAREISRFPANRRDIAVVVAENVPAADILSECKKVGVNQVVGVNLFDVYRGKGVAEGYKSLAISLILQHPYRGTRQI
ncbi:hypothetical protein ACT4UM_05460, partial [Bacillus sp. SS-TM]